MAENKCLSHTCCSVVYILFCSHILSLGGAALWADKILMADFSEEQVGAPNSLEKANRLNETEAEISKDSSEEISKQELLPLPLNELKEGEKDEDVLTGLVDLKEELAVSEEAIGKRKGKNKEVQIVYTAPL